MSHRVCRLFLITIALAVASSAFAGLLDRVKDRLPDPRDKAREEALKRVRIQVPDIDRILAEEPAVSSSFEDAVTAVPYLDDFNPTGTAPLNELPLTPEGAYILAGPGVYEIQADSYCLHAGTRGPSSGNGYLYAPLKGSEAGVIERIVNRSIFHPDVTRQSIQSLIWGIESRAKISEMPPDLQEAAELLLDEDDIRHLNGGAMSVVPAELYDQAFVDIPAPARRILEIQSEIRGRLRAEVYDFEAIEALAVLPGDAIDEDGPAVPLGRWSYHPDGYFLRYFPSGYQQTRYQLYRPEPLAVTYDEIGRITAITDGAENAIQIAYSDQAPLTFSHDDNLRGYAFRRVTLLRGNQVETIRNTGWTLVGVPSKDAHPDNPAAIYADASDRQQWSFDHFRELSELAGQLNASSNEAFATSVNLASLERGISDIIGGSSVSWVTEMPMMLKRAWAFSADAMMRNSAISRQPLQGTRLAQAFLSPFTGQNMTMQIMQSLTGDIPDFKPGSGTAMPGSTGRQRLSTSGRPSCELPDFKPDPRPREEDDEDEDDDGDNRPEGRHGKEILNRAEKAIDYIGTANDLVNFVTDPAGTIASKAGSVIPDTGLNSFFKWTFSSARTISQALGGDPPRPDFDEHAVPSTITMPVFDAGVSPAHTAAINRILNALNGLNATLKAGVITLDRLGGAMQAEDAQWTEQQAQWLVGYKRQAGLQMIEVAYAVDDLSTALVEAGYDSVPIPADSFATFQAEFARTGFSSIDLTTAREIGLTQEQIDSKRDAILATDPSFQPAEVIQYLGEVSDAFYSLGLSWSSLPDAPPGA